MLVVRVDMLPEVILDAAVDILSGIEVIAMAIPAIALECGVEIAYAGDVLADVLAVLITDVVTAIGVDMFADENANGLAAVMTP